MASDAVPSPSGGMKPGVSVLPPRYAFLVVALAVALQVQITVPVTAAGLRLNAGDPLVAGVAGALLLWLWRARWPRIPCEWRMPRMIAWLSALTAILTLSLAVGYLRSGQISVWAVANKYAGWFVLLGYFCAGAWISAAWGVAGQRLFLRALLATAAAIAAVNSFLLLLADFHVSLPVPGGDPQARGLMGNSNAFAFVLLIGMGILYAGQRACRPLFSRGAATAILALLWVGLWYCGSRSAWVTGLGLTACAVLLRALPWREVGMAAAAVALSAVLVVQAMPEKSSGDPNTTTTAKLSSLHNPAKLTADPSNVERFQGFRDAYDLWRGNAVLGVGLGGFLQDQMARYDRPLVVHNTALWILTEMGLVGAIVFAAFAWQLVRSLRPFDRSGSEEDRFMRTAGMLVLAVFAAMSLLHELLFQRVLWIVLGLVMAFPRKTNEP